MDNPHILVIPYPAQGHVIPLLELSQGLVKHGFKITFVNMEFNHKNVQDLLAMKEDVDDRIRLISIPDELGSPENRKQPGKISQAILQVMSGKVEELIQEINGSESKINCVLADQSLGWALEIAEKHGIKRAAFCPAAAALLVLGFSIPKLIDDGIIDQDGTPIKRQMIKLSPTMPPMNTMNFVWACIGNINAQKNIFQLMVRNNESIKLTDWLLCNSTYELEPSAFAMAPKIRPIGPLLAPNRLRDSNGNLRPEDSSCLQWLNQQAPQSVIFIAFGSFTIFDTTQYQELALGLELTGRPFLWVVRFDITDGKKNANLEEFEERIGGKGKVVDWAPQQKVLAHPSIACFISHCGWNSTIEGVSNGIPFLCWPYFADQFFNQSYICEYWNVGLGFDKDGRGIITGEEIRNKVEQVLGNEKYKARAVALKETVMSSIRGGGTSSKNFKDFVEWVVWQKVLICCGLQRPVQSWELEFQWAVSRFKGKSLLFKILKCAWCAYLYFILLERNNRLHGCGAKFADQVVDDIKSVIRVKFSSFRNVARDVVNKTLQENWGLLADVCIDFNHKRVTDAFAKKVDEDELVQLFSIPDGMEDGESRNQLGKLTESIGHLKPKELKKLIQKINRLEDGEITCVVSDVSMGWELEIAAELGVRRAAFWPASALLLAFTFSLQKLIDDGVIIDGNGTPIDKDKPIQLSPTTPAM
ncbi:hypothetical protein PTKIN_Ptkin07bG0065600 [Pterospermum kingtungense]